MDRQPIVTVRVPSMLRPHCGGTSEFPLPAGTVRGALEEIARLHPALHRSVCDETGRLRPHIGLFVNRDHVRDLGGLDAPLAPGDQLTILPAVSGG